MALYETGSASDMDDLVDKLMDFATVTNTDFTEDDRDLVNNEAALNNGTVYIQMTWDSDSIALFQSLGYTGPNNPGAEVDDSGSGGLTAASQRGLHLPSGAAGPYTAYHFFTNPDGTYIHVALEYSPGLYRHMSFGELEKIGDWTGGSYCVGHYWDPAAANIDNPVSLSHAVPFEAASTATPDKYGTLHVEGLPDQGASSKWGVIWGGTSPGTDTAAVARVNILGGMRGGPIINALGAFRSNPTNGFVNLVDLILWYRNATPAPDTLTPLGFVPDMAFVNMAHLTPGSSHVIGTDTWIVFPLVRKRSLNDNAEESKNAGVAYINHSA